MGVSGGHFQGELAALGAAALWAASAVVYGFLGDKFSPLRLNFLKGCVAIALIVLTLGLSQQSLTSVNLIYVFLLLTSGAIGIGIGDTAYFAALNQLGPRKTLLLETLSPPFGAVLGVIFLQETLKLPAYAGILLTVSGVAWVISERTIETATLGNRWVGVGWGLVAAVCQASGAVLSRYALLASGMSPLWSTLLRLLAGMVIVLTIMGLRYRSLRELGAIVWSPRLIGIIFLVAFGSTYLGIWLQQTALKLSPVGIAQTLTATSPLFILPIAALMGDKIGIRSMFGVVLALLGIGLLFQ